MNRLFVDTARCHYYAEIPQRAVIRPSHESRCAIRGLGALALLLVLPADAIVLRVEPQVKQTILDGSKNPELFPDWYVWQETFKTFALWGTNEDIRMQTGLERSEFALLNRFAKTFMSGQAELLKRFEEAKRIGEARRTPKAEIVKQTIEMERNERHRALALSDDLAREMKPAAFARLRQWIYEHIVKNRKVYVDDLKEFRVPR